MTIADSRVVSRWKVRLSDDGAWVTYDAHKETLSLLAEAEREIARLESSVFNVVTERNALQSRLDGVQKLLRDWYDEELRDDSDNRRNAPGHCHDVTGIWDSDNGKRAGKPCARCQLWFAVRSAALGGESP